MIPWAKLTEGRNFIFLNLPDVFVVPKRTVMNIKDLQPVEIFDLSLTIKCLV